MIKIINSRKFKLVMVALLFALTLFGVVPLEAFAANSTEDSPTDGHDMYLGMRYIPFEGEMIPVTDGRVLAVTKVTMPRVRTGLPPAGAIFSMNPAWQAPISVTMQGHGNIHSRRYHVTVGGVQYEAFCADPGLAGPLEAASANPNYVYQMVGEVTGALGERLKAALANGFPTNPQTSAATLDAETRVENAYITRVAVAMAANPSRTFGGDAETVARAEGLIARTPFVGVDFAARGSALLVNGAESASDTGREINDDIAQSETFSVATHRITHDPLLPFRFEWASDTPAGAQLFVGGTLHATAPSNNNAIVSGNVTFDIRMPNTAANQNVTAAVNLVNPNAQFAGRVWRMQNPSNPTGFQDIVFYIPAYGATASFSFTSDEVPPPPPPPPPPPTTVSNEVRIQKIDALTRENIPGALMRLRGMSSHQAVTGDGQIWEIDNTGINISQVLTAGATTAVPGGVASTVTDGVWTLEGLPFGFFMVEEERAPYGYSLLPQHTAFGFWLLPPNVVIQAEGEAIQCPETGEVLHIEIEYEIIEEGGINSILITFENYPFGTIELEKICEVTRQPIQGAAFMIEGYFPESNQGGIPTQRMATTDASGRIVWNNLPAGMFAITELSAAPGFILDSSTTTVPLTWGQTATVVLTNTPMSSLEVIKIDGNTGAGLDGAVFELRDPTTGETWTGTTAGGSVRLGQGSNGNELVPGRTFILTELQAPPGYVLMAEPQEVVLSPGDNNQVTVRNFQNPSLTIIKRDAATHELLAGAVFEVVFENGQPIAGSPFTTDAQGRIILAEILGDNEFERTVIVTEISPPPGYNLASPNWQRVVMRAGEDNVITFDNERMPTLTIQKIDARTGYPIQGAWFDIEYLGATAGTGSGNIGPGGMLTGNPFITDSDGRIVIHGVYSGRYRIREVRAANNYWLTPLEADRTWIIEVRDNEDYTIVVENTLLPTLVITKRNALTWRPIPMTQFRVDFEVPNSPHVQHIGYFMTNMQGQIILPFVQVGWYRVTETRPAFGMTLAVNNNFRVFLQPGDNSYSLIQQGIIASESMIAPMPPTAPELGDEPAFEPDEADREYLQRGSDATENAPTPDIPEDADVEAIEPDMDAIVDGALAPEAGGPENSVYTNFPDDFFYRIDLENIGITLYDNPPLTERMSANLQVWGGDHFWNNELGVWNFPQNSLIIRKENAITGELLQGATFSVTQISSGNDSGLAGTIIGYFTTNHSGIIVIAGLDPGYFLVEETVPPDNFTLSTNNRQHAFLRPDGTSIVEMTFSNLPYSSMIITLRCSVTGAPIPNGEFRITNSAGAVAGTDNGHFWTNLQGEILIPNAVPDSYVITQVTVPPQFVIRLVQSTQTIRVNPTGQIYRVDFFSDPLSQLLITLRCEVTGQPVQGGEFRVTNSAGNVVGNANGIFFTNLQGETTIPNLGVDSYVVTQINAPDGFRLGGQNSQTIFIQRPAETYALNFTNEPYSGLIIQNLDGYNGDPLPGVRFRIDRIGDSGNVLIGEHVTDNNGRIELTGLLGSFNITQLDVPNGWEFDAQPTRIAHVNTGAPTLVTFHSPRMGSLEITLTDEDGNPLSGGRFEVRRQNGQFVGEFVTPASGMVSIPNLGSGWFTVEQTAAPQGFVMTDTGRSVEVAANTVARTGFVNARQPSLIIEKVDTEGNPLAGAEFEVRRLNGELVHRVVTNSGGTAVIDVLAPGAYTITETRAPDGFAIVEPSRAIQVVAGETLVERFVNPRLAMFVIHKIDGVTGESLQGVIFEITTLAGERIRNPQTGDFEFMTDNAGMIRLPHLEAGSYIAVETRPLPGYMMADPMPFVVGHDRDYIITIRNYRYPDYNILKIDGVTQEPLAGVQFEIARYFANGRVGERLRNPADGSFTWTTDRAGLIRIPNLPHGTYVATEIRALPGYMLADPVIFVVDDHHPTTITIRNYRYSEWNILKLDGDTNQPLQGVVFEVAHFFGSGTTGERIRNPQNGSFEFVTDAAGIVRIGALQPGTYIITETRALPGYRAAEPVIITVTGREVNTTVTIRNYRDAQLTIRKINSLTRAPLEGVVFEISRPDGTRLVNPQTGFHDFVTDRNGLIFLPVIEDGRFYLRETRALPGFIVDEEVIAFNIDASARQRDHVLTVENTPAAGLLVIVTDAQTHRPLQGIEVEVRHADGRVITGQMLDGNQPSTPANSPQLAPNGNFLTDSRGRINLNHLAPGVYHVRLPGSMSGYQADTDVHVVTVVAGQQAVLELQIAPLAGLRLLHIDAITGAGIFNVEFMVFDHNGRVVGNFYTDNNGVIDFGAILVPGRYTIRMTRPAPGYARDDVPRTVEFVAGRITEIVWEAIPIAGQLQILKVSGDANQHNGLPAGTPLAGAIFEIYCARTGNIVDRIMSNERGMAISRPLPLGRYIAREVAAPAFYMINPQEIYFVLEHENQIIRVTFPNFSANMGVTIRKTGPQEVMQGHSIVYEIPVIRNDSSTPLADFFWRDVLPTNAVRVDRLVTGTFNHSMRYRVLAVTNRGNEIVAADNLSTLVNNVIELRPVHLGLASNEYVTEIIVFFGQVPAGFTSVERPRIFVDVLSANQAFLPDGMMFANKVDVGGRISGTDEWVIGNSTVASTVFNPNQRRLPQSGW